MRVQLAQQVQEILGKSDLVIITERVDDVALLIGQMVYLAPCGRTFLVHHVPGALPPCPHTRSPVSASCLMGSDHSPSSLPPGGLPRRGPYRPRLISFSSSYTTP